MSHSLNRFWRVFAAITLLNQIVRVPLLLSLVNSAKDLEIYFIISATSIPVQFIAQDILQYRRGTNRLMPYERIGLPLLVCGSIAYVAWHNGFAIACNYLIFSVAILLYGASVGYLREIFTAKRVLAMDALYNTGTTTIAVILSLFIRDGSKLGQIIILSQAGMAIIVCALNFYTIRYKYLCKSPEAMPISLSYDSSSATSLVLISIMATTQLERLVIAASQPVVLICISLAAGITQAWRKIGMDDAVVFERLGQLRGKIMYQAMCSELRHARYVFYPPLIFALIASGFIDKIAAWCSLHGVLRSLNYDNFATTIAILCIYLAVMPPAIVMVNTLRQRIFPLHRLGWSALVIAASLELVAAVFSGLITLHFNLGIFLIILTASLSYPLFLALCPVRLKESFLVLLPDIFIFLLIIIALLWLKIL